MEAAGPGTVNAVTQRPPGDSRRALIDRIAESKPARVLYGMIVGSTGLALAAPHAPSALRVVLAVLGLLVIYWLAHVYVEAVAERLADPTQGLRSRAVEALRHESRLVLGGIPPLAAFVLFLVLGADQYDAAYRALWTTVVMLGFVGYVAARRSGDRGWRLVVEPLVTASFGLFAVGLKTLLH